MSDMKKTEVGDMPDVKSEAQIEAGLASSDPDSVVGEVHHHQRGLTLLKKWSQMLDSLGMEERGLQRVLPDERSTDSYGKIFAMTLLWASGGLNLSSLSGGLIGPLYYGLTFAETTAIVWMGSAIGAAASAYLATFGKRHGLRALANSRYSMGWWPNMAMSALNIVTECGFGVIACLQGGQALYTVSKGSLPLAVGIVIIGLISWIIATMGYTYIQWYQRFAWIFPLLVYIVFFSRGANHFYDPIPSTYSSTANKAGLALSYLSLQIGGSSGWVAVSADYYVYFPESFPSWAVFLMCFFGIWILPAFGATAGAGFGQALLSNAEWLETWNATESVASLTDVVCRPLGGVRYFFIFILAQTMLSNQVFNLYSVGISMQVFGHVWERVPRYVYTFLASVFITLLAVFSRDSFASIISNIASIIGYWTIIFFTIIVEEDILFRGRRGMRTLVGEIGIGYDLSAWDDRTRLPHGFAAGLAFCIGAVGSILAMGQTWYHGPIARAITGSGGDIGIILGFAFSALAFPPLRYLELKRFGR